MIEIRFDRQRGCGWRKPGGLYLVSDGLAKECFRLPVPLTVCPTCHGGIKFTRGFTWIDADALLGKETCQPADSDYCSHCPFAQPIGRAGLLWVGEKFYKTPADFTLEAMRQGVSRRISAVPRDFEIGKTWVLLAHLKAIRATCPDCNGTHIKPALIRMDGDAGETCKTCDAGYVYTPGIFHAFRPTAVEYVVKGDESPDELAALQKRGITPVQIQRTEGGLFEALETQVEVVV